MITFGYIRRHPLLLSHNSSRNAHIFKCFEYKNCKSASFVVSDVAQLLRDGPESLRMLGPAVQSGPRPAAGHLAPGDLTNTPVLCSGAGVLVWTQTARE